MKVHPDYEGHPATAPERQRVPFALAIASPQLLGGAWKKLSWQQQTILKAFYGLPLKTKKERDFWSALQGYGIYDELGFLLGTSKDVPYEPKEYQILTAVLGRRSGKSDRIAGFAAAYEITLGGHTGIHPETGVPLLRESVDKDGNVKVQDAYWLYIAQDLATAKTNMKFVTAAIKDSPLLKKTIVKEGDEEVVFSNGIILRAEPPNIRTARGLPVVGVTMDEVGFWYKDAKSANPDFEVVNALDYALSQFPNSKQLRFSTPWTKEGILFEAFQLGTEGVKVKCDQCPDGYVCTHWDPEDRDKMVGHLVVHAPTAAMGNPLFSSRTFFERARRRNPEAFLRESLARFIDNQTSFLTWSSVERAVDKKVGYSIANGYGWRRPKLDEPGVTVDYVATLDPAFRRDSFVLVIGHHDKALGIVEDLVREWVPVPGERLNPKVVLEEVAQYLREYNITYAYSDQNHLESLQVIAEQFDFTIVGIDWTTKSKTRMMSLMADQFNQNRIRLVDYPHQEMQLKDLQKHVGPTGYISVAAPPSKHDDIASALAMMVSEALKLPPAETGALPDAKKTKTVQFIPESELAKFREWHERRIAEDPVYAAQVEAMRGFWELYGDDSRRNPYDP